MLPLIFKSLRARRNVSVNIQEDNTNLFFYFPCGCEFFFFVVVVCIGIFSSQSKHSTLCSQDVNHTLRFPSALDVNRCLLLLVGRHLSNIPFSLFAESYHSFDQPYCLSQRLCFKCHKLSGGQRIDPLTTVKLVKSTEIDPIHSHVFSNCS